MGLVDVRLRSRTWRSPTSASARLVDQVNPDFNAFKARGGKAIVYQGWQDPVVNALDTVAYYEQVRARQGSQQEIDRFFRLFLVPGMGHCAGGTGATSFGNQNAPAPIVDADHDLLSALDAWVEKDARTVTNRRLSRRRWRHRTLAAPVLVSGESDLQRHWQHRRRRQLHMPRAMTARPA